MSDKQKDLEYEGRREAYLDVDRMLNEGLAGGTVVDRYPRTQIEEASEISSQEEPPAKA